MRGNRCHTKEVTRGSFIVGQMEEFMVQRAAQSAVKVQPKILIGCGWIQSTLQDGPKSWFGVSLQKITRLESLEAQKNVGIKVSGVVVVVDALGCWQSSSISCGSATELILPAGAAAGDH